MPAVGRGPFARPNPLASPRPSYVDEALAFRSYAHKGRHARTLRAAERVQRIVELDQGLARPRQWLWEQIQTGRVPVEDLAELHGRDLACYCKPRPCHGDVLEAAAAWAARKLTS